MAHACGGNRRRKGEKAVFRSDDLFSVPVKTLMAEKCTRGKNTRGDENTRGKNTRDNKNIPTIKIYATVKSHDVRKAW